MRYAQLAALALPVLLAACSQEISTGSSSATANASEGGNISTLITDPNPLLRAWNTPFGVPPFNEIDAADYLPAFRAAMDVQKKEIDVIVANPEPPNFSNTIEALELSGALLSRVTRVFYAVKGANSNDVTKQTASTIAPELSAHRDDISLNAMLFEKVDAVYRNRDSLELTGEQRCLLHDTWKDFVRSGINLDEASQARLRKINAELASLSESFRDNLQNETNTFELLVTDKADLGDLPGSLVSLAAEEAARRGHHCECWVFTLQRPSIDPFLQYSPNRALRRRIHEAYAMRGNNGNEFDNNAIVGRTAELRAERAKLMGFRTHADYVLADRMAGTPAAVYDLLEQVWTPALRKAIEEREALKRLMREDGVEGDLEAWDWRYYTEKLRQVRYDIDEDALRAYFEVNAVRDGAFELANRLYGLTFVRRTDLPVWHPDQQVFEVRDADGSHLAVLYMDFFARESKRGGGWMNTLRQQSNVQEMVRPIVTTNFNFPAPTAESKSLISLSEAETLFHEFGHALHAMFSNVTYETLAGTRTPRDFVEFPSQVMENWMTEPEVLGMFARHYETGETIPPELIEKIAASRRFNKGFETVEYIAAAYLDLAYHTLDSPEALAPQRFEREAMAEIGMIGEIVPRYRSTYFAHIFAGGYSAGYYSYLWSQVLDADAFEAFRENGLFDRETAARFRREILEKGGTLPAMDLYVNFRGRPPEIAPLLERRGFSPALH